MGTMLTWRRARRLGSAVAAAAAATTVLAGCTSSPFPNPVPYQAVNATVTSFDGTGLNVHLYPAANLLEGQTAPTVLEGSGWGLPAYPQILGNVDSLGPLTADLPGPADLNKAGYNVVTWDNRGWFASGGQVNVDSPTVEGRDVSAIIDWLATQPMAELKGPDDPVVGMTGVSYGGGVQLSVAINDHRIDAIEPNMSWNSLFAALYPNQVIKAGWGNLLCASGSAEGARYAPELAKTCTSAQTGIVTQDEIDMGQQVSPGDLVGKITTPTLIIGGTVDTLFPMDGNIVNYRLLMAAGTPVSMLWYNGGHGVDNLQEGTSGYVLDREIAFLDKYLKKEPSAPVGAGFQYQDQTGTWRSAPAYPLAPAGTLTASGGGLLSLNPSDTSGIAGIEATPASNAVNVAIPAPSSTVEVVGAPSLTLTYDGVASPADAPVFAQIVDTSNNSVVDNQATPIRLTLDGATHTVTFPMNVVDWSITPQSRLALQLTDGSDLYFAQTSTGSVTFAQAQLTLPLSVPGTVTPSAS